MNILSINNKFFSIKLIINFFLSILIVHVSLLSTPFALAKHTSPLILANSAKSVEYKSFLHFSSDFHSLTEEYLNQQNAHTKKLKQQIKAAQDLYFQGKVYLSQKYFIEIIKQKWDRDWNKIQRNWIYFSFLRLSQITNELYKKKLLIKEAIAFSPTSNPDPKVFNPPFIKLYNKLYAKTQWDYINDYIRLQDYEKIIINGKVFNIQSNIKIPVDSFQRFRLSLLSNKSEVFSKVLNYTDFLSQNFKQKPLVTGNCNKFKNHTSYKHSIFFSEKCITNFSKSKKELINLFPKQSLKPLSQKKKNAQITKKTKWILISLGVLSAVVIGLKIITAPSHKSGFSK